MMKRYSQAIRFVGFAMAFALALAGCGKGCAQKAAGPEKSSLELIPSDSNVVVGMNWKRISDSPLGAKMKQGMPPEVAPFLQEVDGVVLGINVKGMDKNSAEFVGVVSGKLDDTKLLAQLTEQAKKDGATVVDEDYEGIKLHSSSKDPQLAVAFVEGKGLFGGKEAIKKSIDLTKKKGESIGKNKTMMDLINGVDRNKMIWAVSSIPPGMIPAQAEGSPAGPNNPMAALSSLKAIDLALDYTDNLLINLGVITGKKEDAEQLTTMANSYKTLFGTSLATKDPTLGKVLVGLTIDSKDERVNLSLKLDKATVEELEKRAAEKQAMPMPGGEAPPAGVPEAAAPAAPNAAPAAPGAPTAPTDGSHD